jgi:hypothetical protein
MLLVSLQVTYGLGSAVVNVFAGIDSWLESRHWFTTLVPPAIPAEVWDRTTGSMKGECRQVSRMQWPSCLACQARAHVACFPLLLWLRGIVQQQPAAASQARRLVLVPHQIRCRSFWSSFCANMM